MRVMTVVVAALLALWVGLAGAVVAAPSSSTARDAFLAGSSPGVRVWVDRRGRAVSPSAKFFGGESFGLCVETNEPLYLYAVHVGSIPAEATLFPCAPGGYTLAAGPKRTVRMPCSNRLVFDPLPGTEKILLAWSRRPMSMLKTLAELSGALASRVGAKRLERLAGKGAPDAATGITPEDRVRLLDLRKQTADLLAKALTRGDVLTYDQASPGRGIPVGLYAVATRLQETEVACVPIELAHLTPEIKETKTPSGVTAKDIFLDMSDGPTGGTVATGSGVRYTVLAGGIRPVTPNHPFRSGDVFKLKLDTNADLYCRVYHYTPAGRVFQLYPTRAGEDVLVRRGQSLLIPTAPARFQLDQIPGLERLTLVFSRRKLGVLARPEQAVTGLSGPGQTLYNQMYVRTSGLDQVRQQTQARAKDIHYVADPNPGATTGVYVVDTNLQSTHPILVDVVIIHR